MKTNSTASLQKALLCAQAALEKKAEGVKLLHLGAVNGFTEYFLICSGMSDRQIQAIADSVEGTMRATKNRPSAIEGYNEGRWVLIDLGDVIVHVFHDSMREHFNLERLWAHAPKIPIPAEYYGAGSGASSSSSHAPA